MLIGPAGSRTGEGKPEGASSPEQSSASEDIPLAISRASGDRAGRGRSQPCARSHVITRVKLCEHRGQTAHPLLRDESEAILDMEGTLHLAGQAWVGQDEGELQDEVLTRDVVLGILSSQVVAKQDLRSRRQLLVPSEHAPEMQVREVWDRHWVWHTQKMRGARAGGEVLLACRCARHTERSTGSTVARTGRVRSQAPVSLNKNSDDLGGGGWLIEIQGLGILWAESSGDDWQVTARSSANDYVHWRFDEGDYDSLRAAVSRTVAYLLRAAPPDVRNL